MVFEQGSLAAFEQDAQLRFGAAVADQNAAAGGEGLFGGGDGRLDFRHGFERGLCFHGHRALGLRVVAEGVEDMPQAAWLHDHGCEEAQGYLYAPALDAAALHTRLQTQQAEMAHG